MNTKSFLTSRYGVLVVFAALAAAVPLLVSSDYFLRIGALVWVTALAVVGLHLLTGLAGQISLGHAGFYGIGAYAVAILPARYGLSVWQSAVAGVCLAALLAYVVGKPILRLKGHYLAIATLGFSLLIALAINSESRLTGGPDGINVPTLAVAGHDLAGPLTWYWINGAALAAGLLVAIRLRSSPTGRALRGILDSEVAAASMGVDVAKRKLQVFVIAAVYAAAAGVLLALMNAFVTPDVASFMNSVEFVAMAVIGGLATPFGAVVGAALLTLLPQVLASFHDYEDMLVGLIIMLSMMFLRQGIVPALAQLARRNK